MNIDIDKFRTSIVNATYATISKGVGVLCGISILAEPSDNPYNTFDLKHRQEVVDACKKLRRITMFNDATAINIARDIYASRCNMTVSTVLHAYGKVLPAFYEVDHNAVHSINHIFMTVFECCKIKTLEDLTAGENPMVIDKLDEYTFEYNKGNQYPKLEMSLMRHILGELVHVSKLVRLGDRAEFFGNHIKCKLLTYALYSKLFTQADNDVEVDDVVIDVLLESPNDCICN